MNILVACEYSGVVRDAFKARGHYAMSCDLLPTDSPGLHYQGDVFDIIDEGWDMMIAHPPCTYLTVAGNGWMNHPKYPNRAQDRREAIAFVLELAETPIPKIAIENPVGVLSTLWRKPDQYIQPFEYGFPTTKKTCLWLKNLPNLIPTNIVEPEWVILKNGKRWSKWDYEISGMKDRSLRGKARSLTFPGIAEAMAAQWG